MKTISQLNGVDFLRQCNKLRYAVSDVLKETQIMEIRKRMPDYSDCKTKEERKAKMDEQVKKNLNDMLDVLLEEKPEETVKLMKLFIIPEDGDPEMSGMELTMTGLEILFDPRVTDFLLSLMLLPPEVAKGIMVLPLKSYASMKVLMMVGAVYHQMGNPT